MEESEKLSTFHAGDGQGSGHLLHHSLSTCNKAVYRELYIERLEAPLKIGASVHMVNLQRSQILD